ncbi:hypothetical protein N507_2244 [Lacticaseibacillus rhamnosus DSM 14870]|nr:hypothetical protein N507_2244 [Lacticaseibacillus rhamnosus DSM 14870]
MSSKSTAINRIMAVTPLPEISLAQGHWWQQYATLPTSTSPVKRMLGH